MTTPLEELLAGLNKHLAGIDPDRSIEMDGDGSWTWLFGPPENCLNICVGPEDADTVLDVSIFGPDDEAYHCLVRLDMTFAVNSPGVMQAIGQVLAAKAQSHTSDILGL